MANSNEETVLSGPTLDKSFPGEARPETGDTAELRLGDTAILGDADEVRKIVLSLGTISNRDLRGYDERHRFALHMLTLSTSEPEVTN